jgi:hypothetical protein
MSKQDIESQLKAEPEVSRRRKSEGSGRQSWKQMAGENRK